MLNKLCAGAFAVLTALLVVLAMALFFIPLPAHAQHADSLAVPPIQSPPSASFIATLNLSGAQQATYDTALTTRNSAIATATSDWATQKATLETELSQGTPSAGVVGAAVKAIIQDAKTISAAKDTFRNTFFTSLTTAQKSQLLGLLGL